MIFDEIKTNEKIKGLTLDEFRLYKMDNDRTLCEQNNKLSMY